MTRLLRILFFFSGFAFFVYALFAFVSTLRAKPELRRDLSERYNPFDHTLADLKAKDRQMDLAYAKRLRDDAYARIELADYDNASARLDEARDYDPEGENTSREVRAARQTIADNRMPPSGRRSPGAPASNTGDSKP